MNRPTPEKPFASARRTGCERCDSQRSTLTIDSSVSRRACLRHLAIAGFGACAFSPSLFGSAAGQDLAEADESGLTTGESQLVFADPKTTRYRCGLMLDTQNATCRGVVATFPLLREWPEQKISLVDQSIDPLFARWTERDLGDGLVKQFFTQVPGVRAGVQADALFTYEVTRTKILGPNEELAAKLETLQAPKRLTNDLKQYILESPYIDPGSVRIRSAVREIQSTPASTTWGTVEQVYDWVRAKIDYVEGEIKSADEALRDGAGDCEELTSAFIAICRAMKVPARMVYVLRHCYPEFYLEDEKGAGVWFPCQAAGTRQFGTMEEYRPILQKGDRFRVPDQGLKRYVAEYFKAAAVKGGDPNPRFVQEELE